MTSEEAHQLLDAALDNELDAATRQAFDAVLARDDALRAELEGLRELRRQTALLAGGPSVDLLGSVQEKLRARSGGRFYRDRFAEQQGRSPLLLWTIALSFLLLITVTVWLANEAGLFAR